MAKTKRGRIRIPFFDHQRYPDGVCPKKKQLAAYLRENPGVSNKSYIARQLGMATTTMQKHYDEVRAELAALATS